MSCQAAAPDSHGGVLQVEEAGNPASWQAGHRIRLLIQLHAASILRKGSSAWQPELHFLQSKEMWPPCPQPRSQQCEDSGLSPKPQKSMSVQTSPALGVSMAAALAPTMQSGLRSLACIHVRSPGHRPCSASRINIKQLMQPAVTLNLSSCHWAQMA